MKLALGRELLQPCRRWQPALTVCWTTRPSYYGSALAIP